MKPILFNTEMVRAILDGRKTVTRRVVKLPTHPRFNKHGYYKMRQPYSTGDILYVMETWKHATGDPAGGGYALFDTYVYKADGKAKDDYPLEHLMVENRWHPSIHMPKESARLFLRVTDVRVERVQDITASQAMDEGFTDWTGFTQCWDSTVKKANLDKYGWAANPFVWVISFERISKEEAHD